MSCTYYYLSVYPLYTLYIIPAPLIMVVRPRTYGIYINTHARARAVSSESDALKTARARETPNHQFSDFRGFGAVSGHGSEHLRTPDYAGEYQESRRSPPKGCPEVSTFWGVEMLRNRTRAGTGSRSNHLDLMIMAITTYHLMMC